jgi:predicted nucleic acid-binding protein
VSSRAAYRRAVEIAVALNHHLFDTLYHAVALEEGATLVTADEAFHQGQGSRRRRPARRVRRLIRYSFLRSGARSG